MGKTGKILDRTCSTGIQTRGPTSSIASPEDQPPVGLTTYEYNDLKWQGQTLYHILFFRCIPHVLASSRRHRIRDGDFCCKRSRKLFNQVVIAAIESLLPLLEQKILQHDSVQKYYCNTIALQHTGIAIQYIFSKPCFGRVEMSFFLGAAAFGSRELQPLAATISSSTLCSELIYSSGYFCLTSRDMRPTEGQLCRDGTSFQNSRTRRHTVACTPPTSLFARFVHALSRRENKNGTVEATKKNVNEMLKQMMSLLPTWYPRPVPDPAPETVDMHNTIRLRIGLFDCPCSPSNRSGSSPKADVNIMPDAFNKSGVLDYVLDGMTEGPSTARISKMLQYR